MGMGLINYIKNSRNTIEIRLIPIDIEEHNKMIYNEIRELNQKILE